MKNFVKVAGVVIGVVGVACVVYKIVEKTVGPFDFSDLKKKDDDFDNDFDENDEWASCFCDGDCDSDCDCECHKDTDEVEKKTVEDTKTTQIPIKDKNPLDEISSPYFSSSVKS